MATSSTLLTLQYIFLAVLVVAACSTQHGSTDDDKQVYIVYMGSLPSEGKEYSPQSHHISILQEVVNSRSATDSLVRSYKRSFNGFSAKLTSEEAAKISGKCLKLIGARFYAQGDSSARDEYGHGVHTASIAAGNRVPRASFFGIAEGIATGGVPSARISVYKVCDARGGCQWDDFLAGFDDAIADGVDIIMCSLGTELFGLHWVEDPVAIGTFHAMENGILTVHSAGNSGPGIATTASTVPWLISVAASNTDRSIIDKIVLGNGKTLTGSGINSFILNRTKLPLSWDWGYQPPPKSCNGGSARECNPGCLDKKKVKGKIVVCDGNFHNYNPFDEALRAGAAGAIAVGKRNTSSIEPLPASTIRYDGGYTEMQLYFYSTKNPEGTILKSEATIDSEAPSLTPFSSRGPNMIAPDILKV
ncbi:hypothetical protein Q3G72_021119 [Acer saccharum]|nr:hypothetical protein Q3G72_021119 [Acer saccharum]